MEYLIAIIALFLMVVFFILSRKKGIPIHARPRIESLIKLIPSVKDPAKKVLEADKVLHEALKSLGVQGSMGELLRRHGSKLPNEQPVWNAHKLRNRIAHEPMISISQRQADQAVAALVKATQSLL